MIFLKAEMFSKAGGGLERGNQNQNQTWQNLYVKILSYNAKQIKQKTGNRNTLIILGSISEMSSLFIIIYKINSKSHFVLDNKSASLIFSG